MPTATEDSDGLPERDKVSKPTPLATCKMNPITSFFKSPSVKPSTPSSGIEGYFVKGPESESKSKSDHIPQSKDGSVLSGTGSENIENDIQSGSKNVKKQKKGGPKKSKKAEHETDLNKSLEDFSTEKPDVKPTKAKVKSKKCKQDAGKKSSDEPKADKSDPEMGTAVSEMDVEEATTNDDADLKVVSYEDFLNSSVEDEELSNKAAYGMDTCDNEKKPSRNNDVDETVVEMSYADYLSSVSCDGDNSVPNGKEQSANADKPTKSISSLPNCDQTTLSSSVSTKPTAPVKGDDSSKRDRLTKSNKNSKSENIFTLAKSKKNALPTAEVEDDGAVKETSNKPKSSAAPNIFFLAKNKKNVKPVAALPAEKDNEEENDTVKNTLALGDKKSEIVGKEASNIFQRDEQGHKPVTSEDVAIPDTDEDPDETVSQVDSQPKPAARSITSFFSRTEKKPESKQPKKTSETLTISADIHSNLPSPRIEVASLHPSGKDRESALKRKSNVVVDDLDMSITHIESTVIELPSPKPRRSRVKSANEEDMEVDSGSEKKSTVGNEMSDGMDDVILLDESDEIPEKGKSNPSVQEAACQEPRKSFSIFEKKVAGPECSGMPQSPAGKKKSIKEQKVETNKNSQTPCSEVSSNSKMSKEKKAKRDDTVDETAKNENRMQLAKQLSRLDDIKIPEGKKRAQATLNFSGGGSLLNVKQSISASPKGKKSGRKQDTNVAEVNSDSATGKSTGKSKKKGAKNQPKQTETSTSGSSSRRRGKSTDCSDFESPQKQPSSKVGGKKECESTDDIDTSESVTPRRTRRCRLRYAATLTPERQGLRMKLTKLKDPNSSSSDVDTAASNAKIKSKVANNHAQKLLQRAKDTKVQKGKTAKAVPKPLPKAKGKRCPSKEPPAKKGKTKPTSTSSEDESAGLRRSSRHTAQVARMAISEVYVVDDVAPQKQETEEKTKTAKENTAKTAKENTVKTAKENTVKMTPKKSRPGSNSGRAKTKELEKSPQKGKKKAVKLASIFMKKGAKVVEDDDDVEIVSVCVDPEAERIRKAFLMSGVPETLKRQASQTGASSTSDYPPLPTVSHVQQIPDENADSALDVWHLPNVTASVCRFREALSSIDVLPTSVIKDCLVNYSHHSSPISAANKNFKGYSSISEEAIRYLLAEISVFNPSYPVRRVYRQLLQKKQLAEGKLDSEKEVAPIETPKETKPKGRKRKLELTKEEALEVTPLRRSKRRRASIDCEVVIIGASPEPKPSEEGSTEDTSQKKTISDKPEIYCMQWSEKYRPTEHQEMFGNTSTVKRLHGWLEEWKQRTDLEIRKMKKQLLKQAKRDNTSKEEIKKECDWWTDDDSDFDLGSSDEDSDYDDDDAEDGLCNTQLLCGPHGVGKTALVYALATQLGYKVFEVNASSRRAGKVILAQLQEATQSHQVGKSNLDSMFTTFMATAEKSKEEKAGKQKKMPTAFNNLFNKGVKQGAGSSKNTKEKEEKPKPKEKTKKKEKDVMNFFGGQGKTAGSMDIKKSGLNLSSTSLIFFEEVDVVFEEDKGFWAAIQTFMSTTKRPIIMTSSNANVTQQIDCRHELLTMTKSPSLVNTTTYLQLMCLAENVRTDPTEIVTLVELCHGDLRRASLNLQLWVESGGGSRITDKPVRYSPKFFQKRGEQVGVRSSLYDASLSQTPFIESACDSAEEFLSPVRRKRRRLGPIIDDDSSCSGFSPVKSKLMRQDDDSSQGASDSPMKQTIGVCQDTTETSLAPALDAKDLVTSMIPVPAVHHNSYQGLLGHQLQKDMTLLEELRGHNQDGYRQRLACVSSFFSLDCNIVYSNVCHLLHLPTTGLQPVAPPTQRLADLKPAKRKRIRNDIFDSEGSDEEEVEDSKMTEEADRKQAAASKKEATQSDRIVCNTLSTLSDLYENLSFCDSYLMQSRSNGEGRCDSNMYCDWSRGAVTSGLTSQVSKVDEPNWWKHNHNTEITAIVHVDTLDRTNSKLRTLRGQMEAAPCQEQELLRKQMAIPVPKAALGSDYMKLSSEFPQYQSQALSNKKAVKLVTSCLPSHMHLARDSIPKDIMPYIRLICRSEQMRKVTNTKRRFMHYLDTISLSGITKKQPVVDNLCTSFF